MNENKEYDFDYKEAYDELIKLIYRQVREMAVLEQLKEMAENGQDGGRAQDPTGVAYEGKRRKKPRRLD